MQRTSLALQCALFALLIRAPSGQSCASGQQVCGLKCCLQSEKCVDSEQSICEPKM